MVVICELYNHFALIGNRLLADEVDASSTPVSAGGYFPTFHQDQGQISPIAMTTSKQCDP